MRKKIIGLSLILALAVTFSVTSKTYYSKANGNWNSSSTWNPSGVPGKTDDVSISHTVSLTSDEQVKYLEIKITGILQGNYELEFWNNGSLDVYGIMNIKTIDLHNAGLTFTVNATGEIYLSGDLDINNNTITCNGTIEVGGTLTSGNITGTGSVTANSYNTTSVFGATPTGGVTYYGQSWIGGTSGKEQSWETPSNWASGAVPVSTSVVNIRSGTTVPIISSNAVCNDLVIESNASLIIYPLSSLTIDGDVENNGTILLKSSASGTGSLIENGSLTNYGTIKVERYVTAGSYHYMSSPMNNSPASVFGGATIYAYDETNADTNRNYGWTAVSTSTGTLTNGRGYAVYRSSTATDTFSGSLNSGNISVTATRTNSGSTANPSPDGWNILGNPYPSAINANSFLSNNTDLTGTVYLWADDGTSGSGFTTSDYATYTSSGGVGASGGGSTVAPDGKIAVGQGFFVQVKSGLSSTTVNFNNTMRQTNTTQFYIPKSEVQSFRLDLNDEVGNQNEILISFLEGATEAYDQNYDGVKVQGNPYLSLYSIIQDYELIIQGLPYIQEDVSIPLGYVAGAAGEYTFERYEFSNFGDNIQVYLEDQLTGSRINLLETSTYKFSSEAGKFNERFVVHFEKTIVNSVIEEDFSEINVYANTGIIYLNNPSVYQGIVSIYNINGEKIKEVKLTGESIQNIEIGEAVGVYLVCIEKDSIKQTKKVILN